ncbi:MAG: hypothetical protein ABI587_05755 [Gemmatimonadales bacterium]
MSSRRWSRRLCLALLCLPRLVTAQTEMARLTARADSLATLWREANAVADLVDSLAHRPAPVRLDTMRIGGLSIIATNPPIYLRAAADSAWRVLDAFYGTAAAELAERPYRIAGLDSGQTSTEAAGQWGHQVPRNLPLDLLTRFLIGSARIGDPDPPLRAWLGDVVRPALDTSTDLTDVYTTLVTSPFSVAHDCFLGDVDGCRSALNLDAGPGALLRRYRTPEDRRLLMRLVQSHFYDAAGKAGASACLDGADAACIELLQTLPFAALAPPLPLGARQTLIQLAVRSGGREGYQRLTGSTGHSMSERLSLTAAVPADSLIQRWWTQVIRHRPEPVAVPFGVVSAGLGWILIFGLCGLGSSRWRVG